MNKGRRELQKMLKTYRGAKIVNNGRSGYTLDYRGRSMHLGGLSAGLNDRHKIEQFLKEHA